MTDKSFVLEELHALVLDRMSHRVEGSYTTYLLEKGEDKVCRKVGEEVVEMILAVKNHKKEELLSELADLFFHLTVLMASQDISYDDVYQELLKRRNN